MVLQRQGHGHFTLLSYQEKVYGEKSRSFQGWQALTCSCSPLESGAYKQEKLISFYTVHF
jgi:hypothetical protein